MLQNRLMHNVAMRGNRIRVGTLLAILALALQVAWPLLANAKPRSVALVPLCSVDGVTHYLEVPTGNTPLEESASHGDHCPLCFLGHAAGLPAHFGAVVLADTQGVALPASPQSLSPKPIGHFLGARAPPFSRVVP